MTAITVAITLWGLGSIKEILDQAQVPTDIPAIDRAILVLCWPACVLVAVVYFFLPDRRNK